MKNDINENGILMRPIAKIHTDFSSKFGVPRQSGLVEELQARIVFEKEYRSKEALRGIEDWSHLWLIWHFSQAEREGWSPTVRPPKLGGNKRVGVFATRSPFRPNAIGLSCVKLIGVEHDTAEGDVLIVGGADLMDGTPIFDIKPYLPLADAKPQASGGFTDTLALEPLCVEIAPELLCKLPQEKQASLIAVLEGDPRPAYQSDPERIYGFGFAGFEIRFQVEGNALKVLSVEKA